MSFGGWALANPAGLWFALLALPIIALHVLKPRRVQAVVPALFLWRKVATPVSAASPWQRLTPSWLLAAQVLAALLLALLLARPVQLTDQPLAEHTIFVIDASASMQANDGVPDRLQTAVDRAKELRRQVPEGGEASIVVAGSRARATLTHSSDQGTFDEALDRIEPTAGRGDFAGAFALSAGLDTGDRPTRVVFISDGGVPDADLRTAPVGTRYERVGTSETNRGITQLSVEPAESGLIARVTVAHFGGPEATQTLRLDVDGRTVERLDITLASGDVINEAIPLPFGEKIEAFLESEDAFDLDDRAVATVARRAEISVLVAGPPNAFLDAALAASPSITVERVAAIPAEVDGRFDVVIADRVAVPDALERPLLAIAPPGGVGAVDPDTSVIRVSGVVERPALTLIRADRPLVRDVDLSDVLVATAQRLQVPLEADVILGAEGAPLLVTLERLQNDVAYLAFAVDESTLPLQAAFPVLIDRLVTDLADAVTPPARLTVGADLPVDSRLAATITSPLGTSETIPAGSAIPAADRLGFWTVEQDGRAPITVAVNGDRTESAVAPLPDLPFERAFEGTAAAEEAARGELPTRLPVILLLLAVLVAEWLLARRRVGVSRPQWIGAQALRAVVAIALVMALLGLSINRSTDRVAAVFLIDGSDSIGPGGRSQARATVLEALDSRPDEDVAGVVAFGRDARLETLVDDDPDFAGLGVQIDTAATDVSAALRLGAAALPGDARGRLVLLSDGRATTGDTRAEIERLAEEGIPVDVYIVASDDGTDVAVSGIDVPGVAREGEEVPIDVQIAAPRATTAQVTLRKGDEIVGQQTVALAAGDNTVRFTDVASGQGVLRYRVQVESIGDGVSANDIGFAAVPVEGAERVLVIEGRSGQADEIVSSLEATGLPHDVVPPGNIPAIDELTQYASIVLVDVDRRDLSDRQVQDLSAAVRDLGRGMLVLGGTHSYALGGYRDSDLEEILPVISEITDPLRRQTVAEVLAIDTSGSMGACHCNEDGANGLGGGNRIDGGVSKTAIARNAASRAIAALGATDEVGVLSVDANDEWVIDLQARPAQDVVDDGLSQLVPDGPTFVDTALSTSAEALRASDASLKHIIFFSDGFTEPSTLSTMVEQAAALLDEGITVSVVATGEGAAEDLRPIADAGGGRFYPGRNLEQLPEIIVQEAVLASRDFVNEGEFLPTVTSSASTVQGLTSSPPLLGYVATTAKPTARVDLRIGPDQDPLLASWQIGLGRVSAWTSDGSSKWGAPWAGWAPAPSFWAGVIKETFPIAGDGGVQARIEDGQLELRVEGSSDWADRSTATVRVASPDGTSIDVPLERLDGSTFAASVPIDQAGTYAVGAHVVADGETLWAGVGITSRSYPEEYAPRPVETDALTLLAEQTGGRVAPAPLDLFSPEGTTAGERRIDLTPWLLLLAALLWPIAVAISRLAWRRGLLAVGTNRAAGTVTQLRDEVKRRAPKIDRPAAPPQPGPSRSTTFVKGAQTPSAPPSETSARPVTADGPPTAPPAAPAASPPPADEEAGSTMDQLLARKRRKP